MRMILFGDAPVYFEMKPIEGFEAVELHPEERAFAETLGEKRKKEFIVSRSLCQSILRQMEIKDWPVLVGKDRMPNWPKDICGSISHTKKNVYVAIVKNWYCDSLGIDAEERSRLQKKHWKLCLTEREIKEIEALPENLHIETATLAFSAKESFYKYQYPLTKLWLGFHDVEIAEINEDSQHFGGFNIRILKKDFPIKKECEEIEGTYVFEKDEVITTFHNL